MTMSDHLIIMSSSRRAAQNCGGAASAAADNANFSSNSDTALRIPCLRQTIVDDPAFDGWKNSHLRRRAACGIRMQGECGGFQLQQQQQQPFNGGGLKSGGGGEANVDEEAAAESETSDSDDDGSVASRLLGDGGGGGGGATMMTKSISSPSLLLAAKTSRSNNSNTNVNSMIVSSCKESVRETPYQKTLKLKKMKLNQCAEEIGSESSSTDYVSVAGNPDSDSSAVIHPESFKASLAAVANYDKDHNICPSDHAPPLPPPYDPNSRRRPPTSGGGSGGGGGLSRSASFCAGIHMSTASSVEKSDPNHISCSTDLRSHRILAAAAAANDSDKTAQQPADYGDSSRSSAAAPPPPDYGRAWAGAPDYGSASRSNWPPSQPDYNYYNGANNYPSCIISSSHFMRIASSSVPSNSGDYASANATYNYANLQRLRRPIPSRRKAFPPPLVPPPAADLLFLSSASKSTPSDSSSSSSSESSSSGSSCWPLLSAHRENGRLILRVVFVGGSREEPVVVNASVGDQQSTHAGGATDLVEPEAEAPNNNIEEVSLPNPAASITGVDSDQSVIISCDRRPTDSAARIVGAPNSVVRDVPATFSATADHPQSKLSTDQSDCATKSHCSSRFDQETVMIADSIRQLQLMGRESVGEFVDADGGAKVKDVLCENQVEEEYSGGRKTAKDR